MKTKFKYVSLALAAILLSFTGCSNDDGDTGGTDNSEPKSVFLKLDQETPSTYTEGPAATGTVTTLNSGNLYFVNAAGSILAHYTITSGATSDTNISLVDIIAGATITNLPGSVTTVHVVGNTAGIASPVGKNISEVKTAILQVQSQGDLTDLNLYGNNTLTLISGTSYSCNIPLKPTVARIELTNITGTGAITGFQVDGIFIDNYYSQAVVDGTVNASNLKFNGASAAAFGDGTTEYPAVLKPSVYDYYTSGLAAVTNVAKPAGVTTLWGYNVLASASGSEVPRIIIRLSNVTTSDGSDYSGTQYLTITGLKQGGTLLTAVKAGEVYKIDAGLTFSPTDLTPTPNLNTIDVTVTVTLATWTVVTVTPEL